MPFPYITAEERAGLTVEQLLQLKVDIDAWKIAHSPAGVAQVLTEGTTEPWQPYPHLVVTNTAILDLVDPDIPFSRLLVTEPPRHGKSHLCSLYLPIWYLNQHPDRRVILASYGDDFAAEWGRKVRDLITMNEQHLRIRVSGKSSAADRWELDGHLGGMKTAGVGGQVTGRGAHLLIIDDPVKDAEEAESLTIRDKKWDWWRSTIQTRLEPGAVVLLIQTRWHEDDLAGRILQHEPEKWHHVNLPALAEDADPLGRKMGEALCPARYDSNALGAIRESIGNHAFSALYQQRPMPEGGGMFKREHFHRWRYAHDADQTYMLFSDNGTIRVPINECYRFATVDLALKMHETADYTCVGVWDTAPYLDPVPLILRKIIRVRIDGSEHVNLLRAVKTTDQPKYFGIESASFGSLTIANARRQGLIVRELKVKTRANDKWFRAKDAALLAEQGRLYIPEKAEWLMAYEHELLIFNSGTHDDQVDVTAYAAREVLNRTMVKAPERTANLTDPSERVWDQLLKKRREARYHPVLGDWS